MPGLVILRNSSCSLWLFSCLCKTLSSTLLILPSVESFIQLRHLYIYVFASPNTQVLHTKQSSGTMQPAGAPQCSRHCRLCHHLVPSQQSLELLLWTSALLPTHSHDTTSPCTQLDSRYKLTSADETEEERHIYKATLRSQMT